jgi:hypothetical protein
MSTTYAGDPDLFADLITKPSDGDNKPAATVNTAIEALADRTAFLEARASGVAKPGTATQIHVPLVALNIWGLSEEAATPGDRFIFSALANVGAGWLQVDVTDQGALTFDLSACLPKKCRITYISAVVACATHAADPTDGGATLPRLTLLSEDTSQKTSVIVNTYADDMSSDQATYEARHLITIDCVSAFGAGGLAWDALEDLVYYVSFRGETGTDTQANKLLLKAIYVTIEEA